MFSRKTYPVWLTIALVCLAAVGASAQSFKVQCPASTITHPNAAANNSEPAYVGPTYRGLNGYGSTPDHINGAIKCQQISGGDGFATMGDGSQTYMFSFGPLSGLADIANGKPGTQFPNKFNVEYTGTLLPGDPATTIDAGQAFDFNGAVGLLPDIAHIGTIYDIAEGTATVPGQPRNRTVVVTMNAVLGVQVGDMVKISTGVPGYDGVHQVTAINVRSSTLAAQPVIPRSFGFAYRASVGGLAEMLEPANATAATLPGLNGHVDPRQIMDVGVMNGNIPAPLMAIDEDDEFFLTLTNVGQIMRPDLFEQHTVHFHGYPNASAFYDGVPDASVAINIGGSFTYYYLAPDAGTYFWHCHITPPEHLQMGMVGQIYVRPRQDRVPEGGSLYAALQEQQKDLRTACTSTADILCSNPLPAATNSVTRAASGNYAYNDGDGSTYYDVEYPLQIHGFDPNFHFVGMTFNPEGFTDMKDKYFLLNGRSYPDTIKTGPIETQTTDGAKHFAQPLPAIINIPAGGKALLRISDLDVTEYQTLASLGIPMKVIALNAKLLRDQSGNNMYYNTNSITLAGGESLDVILDASNVPAGTYYLYTPNLDHLSNDAENFGGLMTEVHVCSGTVSGGSTFGNTCN